MITWLLDF